MGGPGPAPQTPLALGAPGEAGALLDVLRAEIGLLDLAVVA